jgi:hypothetical protein
MPPRPIALQATCPVLLWGQPAHSQPPCAQGEPASTAKAACADRYGDPLPTDVIARGGIERLRGHSGKLSGFVLPQRREVTSPSPPNHETRTLPFDSSP